MPSTKQPNQPGKPSAPGSREILVVEGQGWQSPPQQPFLPLTTPVITGELGTLSSGLGMMGLGAGPVLLPAGGTAPLPPTNPRAALPLQAHVYDFQWNFLTSLTVLSRPVFKANTNGGYEKITLDLDSGSLIGFPGTGILAPGEIVAVSEQGGDGSFLFAGTIETVIDRIQGAKTTHQVSVAPFVSEIGDGGFNRNYTTPTDVGQIVRDACAGLLHVWYNWLTVPLTGILVTNNFNNTTPQDAVNQALKMAGPNYQWHCDAIGGLWFQPKGSAPFTASQFESRESQQDITGLKNQIQVFGGVQTNIPPVGQGSAPVQSTYNGTSQAQLGVRRWDPPPVYPGITDPNVIAAIAQNLGALFDRVKNIITLNIQNFPQRILIGQLGGALLRFIEPSEYAQEQSEDGSGLYSPTWVVLDVQYDGPRQIVTLGDLAFHAQQDWQWEVVRTLQRTAINATIYTPNSLNTLTVMAPTGTTIVQDTSGIQRLQWGQLPAYTDPLGVVSPAELGLRVLDASGDIIMDSIGISKVMSQPGGSAHGGNSVGNPGLTGITGSSYQLVQDGSSVKAQLTVTPSRQTSYLILGVVVVNGPTANPTATILGRVFVDGAIPTDSPQPAFQGGASPSTAFTGDLPFLYVATVPAGSHTFDVRINPQGSTYTMFSFDLFAFQLGS